MEGRPEMGKIAVFTVFRNTNYGAVLQAYALTRVLRLLSGEEVFLIDYIRDQNTNLMYNGIVFHGKHGRKTVNLQSLKKAFKSLLNYSGTVERTNVFNRFIGECLPVLPHSFFAGDAIRLDGFDCGFVGSDQIWNPELLRGFHDAYFGITTPKLGRVVAYAPSLGKTEFSEGEMRELARKLENVDTLSCREEKGCRFLEQLTGRHVEQVLDPTMLLTADEWKEVADGGCRFPDQYVLVYSLKSDKWLLEQAMKHARVQGKKVLLLAKGDGHPPKGVRYERAYGPAQFISAVSHADCVFTDSFHGTAFSILFGKKFIVRTHGKNGERMKNICGMLGFGERVFRNAEDIPDIEGDIDYATAHGRLEGLRTRSLEYIVRNLRSPKGPGPAAIAPLGGPGPGRG
jgi:hypothetical protein